MKIKIYHDNIFLHNSNHGNGVEHLILFQMDSGAFEWKLIRDKVSFIQTHKLNELTDHELRKSVLGLNKHINHNDCGTLLISYRRSGSLRDVVGAIYFFGKPNDIKFLEPNNKIEFDYDFYLAISSMDFESANKINMVYEIINS